jgi:hypothetical protein
MKKRLSRRDFLRNGTSGLTGFAVISAAGTNLFSIAASAAESSAGKQALSETGCEFGVEGSAPHGAGTLDPFLKAANDLGAGFVVLQMAPRRVPTEAKTNDDTWRWEATAEDFRELSLACKKYNMSFFINQECTNYSAEGEFLDKNGNDILAHPDKTHRWDLTGEMLDDAASHKEFRGVLYDEPEHGQMRRTANTNGGGDSKGTGRVHPYFAATDGMTLTEAYDAVYKSAKAVAANYRRKGVTPMTEDVFPAMMFTFARAGFDIATKFMKEGIDSVYGAIAMGAARQYGTQFCVSPDMWGLSGFPGHPPEELRASMLYAYWLGATKIFVENIRGMMSRKSENGLVVYETSPYGKVFRDLTKEYFPAHPRNYTFRDIRPEVAILRFDDSCWGQKESWLPDALYGAENLHTTPEAAAWFQIWHLLTHGQAEDTGISYHNRAYKDKPHDFFCPLKGVIVYDHLAGAKELEGLKLVFLTGVMISPDTLKAVQAFVREGGLCISLDSLVPVELKGRMGEFKDGSGSWLIVKDFRSDEVRQAVAPFLGKPDEISYLIGKQKLTVKRGKDGNTISIYLQDVKDIPKNGDMPESAKIL